MKFILRNLGTIIALGLLIVIAINPDLLWVFGQWFSDLVSPRVMLPVQ